MKVRDLIEKLAEVDPNARVLITGYEAGADEPSFHVVEAAPNQEAQGYNGDWIAEVDEFDRPVPLEGRERVILLARPRQ